MEIDVNFQFCVKPDVKNLRGGSSTTAFSASIIGRQCVRTETPTDLSGEQRERKLKSIYVKIFYICIGLTSRLHLRKESSRALCTF